MKLIGKYTIRRLDKKNELIDEVESYNVITSLGRKRILDLWAFNLSENGKYASKPFGFQKIDTSPTEITGGTRRCSFFDVGYLTTMGSSYSTDFNAYDWYLTGAGNTESEIDAILNPDNNETVTWYDGETYPGRRQHAIDLAVVDTSETFTVDISSDDQTIELIGSNLKYDSSDESNVITVTDATVSTIYTLDTDYTYDRESGTVTLLNSGSIINGDDVIVNYRWHDISLFNDGIVGIYINGFYSAEGGYNWSSTNFGGGCFSLDAGQTWENMSFPYTGSINHGDNTQRDYRLVENTNYPLDNNENERYFMTHPFLINNPTTFGFMMSMCDNRYMYIKNFNFLKPVYNPQTPGAMAVGTGTTSPSSFDTELINEIGRFDVIYGGVSGTNLGRWVASIDYDECNGYTIGELGIFYGDEYRKSSDPGWTYFYPIQKENCNNLFSRTVFSVPFEKTSEEKIELIYEITLG